MGALALQALVPEFIKLYPSYRDKSQQVAGLIGFGCGLVFYGCVLSPRAFGGRPASSFAEMIRLNLLLGDGKALDHNMYIIGWLAVAVAVWATIAALSPRLSGTTAPAAAARPETQSTANTAAPLDPQAPDASKPDSTAAGVTPGGGEAGPASESKQKEGVRKRR